jgi:hypothetical protein
MLTPNIRCFFGQIITINFAMIVASYYFLHRATLPFRVAAFVFYAVGMLALIALMIEQGDYQLEALAALAGIPAAQRSHVGDSVLALNQSGLHEATGIFLNASLWVFIAVAAYLPFWWRGDPDRKLLK